MAFSDRTVAFLAELGDHNDRDWFAANRAVYDEALMPEAKAFVTAIGEALSAHTAEVHAEPRVNGSIFRINRDTRFSKDKRPYKDHLDMMFWVGEGRSRERPGFFFRLTRDRVHLGAGKHMLDKAELQRFREAVAGPAGERLASLVAELSAAGFEVGSSHYKRVPRGFDADHPRSGLLRYNALFAAADEAHPSCLAQNDFVAWCDRRFRATSGVLGWLV